MREYELTIEYGLMELGRSLRDTETYRYELTRLSVIKIEELVHDTTVYMCLQTAYSIGRDTINHHHTK
jgi:hypothetical protein